MCVCVFAVDFGVSAQLDKTVGRRNTFIGTPYWYVVITSCLEKEVTIQQSGIGHNFLGHTAS